MSDLSTPATLEYYDELAKSLPAPIPDNPEHRHRRLATAIEAFQALRPGDAYEGRLAVQIVLCGAHAVECMLEASIHREDFAKRSRCRAQANSFQREERAAKQILAREQKLRLETEAVTEPTAAASGGGCPAAIRRDAKPPPPHGPGHGTQPRSPPPHRQPPRRARVTPAAAPPAEAAGPPRRPRPRRSPRPRTSCGERWSPRRRSATTAASRHRTRRVSTR